MTTPRLTDAELAELEHWHTELSLMARINVAMGKAPSQTELRLSALTKVLSTHRAGGDPK